MLSHEQLISLIDDIPLNVHIIEDDYIEMKDKLIAAGFVVTHSRRQYRELFKVSCLSKYGYVYDLYITADFYENRGCYYINDIIARVPSISKRWIYELNTVIIDPIEAATSQVIGLSRKMNKTCEKIIRDYHQKLNDDKLFIYHMFLDKHMHKNLSRIIIYYL